MGNITLSISDETKKKMQKYPSVRWSNAVRVMIERKIHDFETTERLAKKMVLSEKDVEKISLKVNASMARHAKRLLNEIYG